MTRPLDDIVRFETGPDRRALLVDGWFTGEEVADKLGLYHRNRDHAVWRFAQLLAGPDRPLTGQRGGGAGHVWSPLGVRLARLWRILIAEIPDPATLRQIILAAMNATPGRFMLRTATGWVDVSPDTVIEAVRRGHHVTAVRIPE